jgi:acyl-CoA thioesterase
MNAEKRQVDLGPQARQRIWLRENWYRDVWLLLNTIFAVVILLAGVETNNDRVDDIQQSRFLFQFQACINTNARNLEAKKRANALMLSPEGKKTVETLVDALGPFVRDCEARARDGVRLPAD